MKMREHTERLSGAVRYWGRTALQFAIPFVVWTTAAAIGGLFVWGCGSSSNNPMPTPTPTPTPTPATYSIGGTISGLPTTATAQALVLQDNGGDNLTVPAGGTSFTFATALADKAAYSVSVLKQPTGFNCTVGSATVLASGNVAAAAVTNIPVSCVTTTVATYTIGGTISGLPTTATAQALVLQDNGGDNLTVPAGGTSFTFATALADKAAYSVSVLKQPTGFNCTVGSATVLASGNVAAAAVTNIPVSCLPTSGGATGTVLATVNNVQPSVMPFYNSSLSFFNIFSPASAIVAPAAPIQIGAAFMTTNVLSVAIDSANIVYYLANSGSANSAATFFMCTPPLVAGGSYTCAAPSGNVTLPGGQWLAVDGAGNAYVAEIQGAASGVTQFKAAVGPTSGNQTPVYGFYASASAAPQAYYGLAVSIDGKTIYVAEGVAGAVNGMGIKIHGCATPCTDAAANDITQTLIAAAGSSAFVSASFSGALGIGPQGTLYLGEGNAFGSTTAPQMIPVALVCLPGAVYHCATGSQSFNVVEGDISPFQVAAAIAADPSGNAYVAAVLDSYGDSSLTIPPAPTFMAFLAAPVSATTLTPFFCSTVIAAPPGMGGITEPNCPVNLLPAPPVLDYKGQLPTVAAPYSMAITLPAQ